MKGFSLERFWNSLIILYDSMEYLEINYSYLKKLDEWCHQSA